MAIGFIVRPHISVAVLCVAAQLTHCSVQPILRHLSLQSSHTDAMLGPSLGAAASDAASDDRSDDDSDAASDDRSDDDSDQDEPQEASGGAYRPAVNAIGQKHNSPTLDLDNSPTLGWGDAYCAYDGKAPLMTCRERVVIVPEQGASGSGVTEDNLPLPMSITDTGPTMGSVRVERYIVGTEGAIVWEGGSATERFSFTAESTNVTRTGDELSATLAVGSAVTLGYRVSDSLGNTRTSEIEVSVNDIDECVQDTHNCHADADCTNLDHTNIEDHGSFTRGTRATDGTCTKQTGPRTAWR